MRVERTFAWEDKFKRLLLRFERIQQRHYGMKLLAYTLINLRKFCGTYNSQPVNVYYTSSQVIFRMRPCLSCILHQFADHFSHAPLSL
jgi:hypothetical protein